MGREVDFLPGHFFQQPVNVRLFHEAETHFDGDNAPSLMIAVEDRYAIPVPLM
jgi:hypothetical protein